jgi:hypothetical protein
MEKTKDPSAKYYATVVVQMGIVMYILHDCKAYAHFAGLPTYWVSS